MVSKYVPSRAMDEKNNWSRRAEAYTDWKLKNLVLGALGTPFFCMYNGARALFEEVWCKYSCPWCGSQYHRPEDVDQCDVAHCKEKKRLYGKSPWGTAHCCRGGSDGDLTVGFDGENKYIYDGTDRYYPR